MKQFNRLAPREDYAAALRWVDRAVRLTPRELLPVEARGYLQLKLGYTSMAIEDLKIVAAQKWYDGSQRAVIQLAELLREADRPDDADKFLRIHGQSVRDLDDPAFA